MRADISDPKEGSTMWKTVVPAAAVLVAEAIIRRRINALPAATFMSCEQTRYESIIGGG